MPWSRSRRSLRQAHTSARPASRRTRSRCRGLRAGGGVGVADRDRLGVRGPVSTGVVDRDAQRVGAVGEPRRVEQTAGEPVFEASGPVTILLVTEPRLVLI